MSPLLTDKERYAPLDGVRGLAILIVLVHNSASIGQVDQELIVKIALTTTSIGWTGVELFFVLSGFLITSMLLDAVGSPSFFRIFYIRRTLRIFPLYYVFLAMVFIGAPILSTSATWLATVKHHQWWYWLYVSNWTDPFDRSIFGLTHLWSLAVEEQFYLVWPLAVYLLSRRRLAALCLVAIVTAPMVRFLLTHWGLPPWTAYSFTIARWDALAAGSLLTILWRSAPGRLWLATYLTPVALCSLLALLVLLGVQHGFHQNEMPVQVFGQTLIAVLSTALVYFSIAESAGTSSLQRALSAPWLRFLGKYSYAIYIFHVPIHCLLAPYLSSAVNQGVAPGRLVRLALYVAGIAAVSIGLALSSWRLLEKPCLDLRNRLAPQARLALSGGGLQ